MARRKPSCFRSVVGKLPPIKPIEKRDSPVCALVGLRRLSVDLHDLGLGRRSLGNRGGLEPCGGLDWWALFRRQGIIDGRLVEVSGEDVQGDRGPCRCHLCQFVCGLIKFSRDVVEFETIELVFKVTYQLAVRLHFGVMAV